MPSRSMVFESGVSTLRRSRSRFDLSHKNTLTATAGKLYPMLAYSDCLPGDTHKIDMSLVCRSTTPITAPMDDAYIQCEFWWVPHALVLSRASMSPSILDAEHSWKAFIGAQESLLNVGLLDADDPMLPVLQFNGTSISYASYRNSLAHFLDYPYIPDNVINVASGASGKRENLFFNPFAMLAFYQVWSDAYREPNLWNPVTYSISAIGSISYINFTTNPHAGINSAGNIYTNVLPSVCREHGYIGSALPWPQRNLNPTVIKLGEPLKLSTGPNYQFEALTGGQGFLNLGVSNSGLSTGFHCLETSKGGTSPYGVFARDSTDANTYTYQVDTTNLYADLSKVGSITINTLRYSFALQAYYEALGRMGNRYDDIIRMYGVNLNRCDSCSSEYLGGKRIPLSQAQVVAAAQGSTQGLGSIGGFSNTSDSDHYFTKSFDDFGTIVGVFFIRHHDTLWNNLSKERSRVMRMQYWNPYFARIGETPVYRNEVFVNYDSTIKYGASVVADYIQNPEFGFQEYGADYRYHEDTVHGEVVPTGSQYYWTYATNWINILGNVGSTTIDDLTLGEWLDGSMQVYDFDQTLQTSNATAGFQFQVQFYFNWTAIRNIPAHSIPAVLGQR